MSRTIPTIDETELTLKMERVKRALQASRASMSEELPTVEPELRSTADRIKRALHVSPASMLAEVPDVTVQLGTAPDGMPLLLSVRRSANVIPVVLGALGRHTLDDVDPRVRALLKELQAHVSMLRRDIGVRRDATQGVFVTDATVPALLGQTLFVRLLTNSSPMVDEASRSHREREVNEDRDVRTCAGVVMSIGEMKRALEATANERHLAIPLIGTGACSVVTINRNDPSLVPPPRPLDLESFASFGSARAVFRPHRGNREVTEHHEMGLGDEEYRQCLVTESLVHITVSRADMLTRLAEVCADVEALQRNERQIHGDLKPANILVGPRGARAFDPSGTRMGDVSVAGTPSWSAPEQIMALPVTPAADVYALALLLARVLGATIYGEQRAFTIPISGQRRARIELLAEPEAFIDPTLIRLPDEGYRAWCALLKEGLAFDTKKRIPTPLAFAERLTALAAKFPPESQPLACRPPGTFTRDVLINDELTSGWVMKEGCAGAAAQQLGNVQKAITR